MKIAEDLDTEARRRRLLDSVDALVPDMQARAAALDRDGVFPEDDLNALREVGALAAIMPETYGGLGLGTEAAGACGLLTLLRLIGRANLSVGRIVEGHVNALALIAAYGSRDQIQRASDEAIQGHLFAIWNTEQGDGLRLQVAGDRFILHGEKAFCSAAGYATRAVVTAHQQDDTERMLVVALDPTQTTKPMAFTMQGMRAALIGRVAFDNIELMESALIGRPGDYLREPHFSAGAWRTSAVTLGGLEALVTLARRQLVERGRAEDPHQRTRMGQALIATETARLWVQRAGLIAEGAVPRSTEDIVAYVNLARIAVEAGVLDALHLVQRSLGLASLLHPSPIERLMRDLSTYLRQPAPDAVLTEAAARYMNSDRYAIDGAS